MKARPSSRLVAHCKQKHIAWCDRTIEKKYNIGRVLIVSCSGELYSWNTAIARINNCGSVAKRSHKNNEITCCSVNALNFLYIGFIPLGSIVLCYRYSRMLRDNSMQLGEPVRLDHLEPSLSRNKWNDSPLSRPAKKNPFLSIWITTYPTRM